MYAGVNVRMHGCMCLCECVCVCFSCVRTHAGVWMLARDLVCAWLYVCLVYSVLFISLFYIYSLLILEVSLAPYCLLWTPPGGGLW